jgi:hypothetical protein
LADRILQTMIKPLYFTALAASVLLLAPIGSTVAQERPFEIEFELGSAWQARNDVQIPSDKGTRFALDDVTGSGPWVTGRVNFNWNVKGQNELRLVLAPLGYDETGFLPQPVEFAGQSFTDGQPVEARYRFNSWRATYRYRFDRPSGWQFWAGVTAKVRDAEIRLIQGETVGLDDDTGLVPLLHLAARYRINDRWSFDGDLDGLAGGPGRAFDLSLRFNYQLDERWSLGLGYRGLEGGVDNDEVYNFAWFNSVVANLRLTL